MVKPFDTFSASSFCSVVCKPWLCCSTSPTENCIYDSVRKVPVREGLSTRTLTKRYYKLFQKAEHLRNTHEKFACSVSLFIFMIVFNVDLIWSFFVIYKNQFFLNYSEKTSNTSVFQKEDYVRSLEFTCSTSRFCKKNH